MKAQLPLYLLSKEGRPLVWEQGGQKTVLGYSDAPFAVAAANRMRNNGMRQIQVLSVSTRERFQQVVAQLARHGVHAMLWDYCGEESTRRIIKLG